MQGDVHQSLRQQRRLGRRRRPVDVGPQSDRTRNHADGREAGYASCVRVCVVCVCEEGKEEADLKECR